MGVDVKICGIRDEAALRAAVNGGARYVGFVFVPGVRRYISPEAAAALAKLVPDSVQAVGLFENPGDEELLGVVRQVPLKIIQLHGHETVERVQEAHAMTGLKVMKVIHVAAAEDLEGVRAFEAVADMLLFDTKLGPKPTGGTGKSFDWSLLKGRQFSKPWMLAGGINIGNIAEAAAQSGARIIDLSSGVEDAAGNKEPAMIKSLLEKAAII